jgi:hypothetical protein
MILNNNIKLKTYSNISPSLITSKVFKHKVHTEWISLDRYPVVPKFGYDPTNELIYISKHTPYKDELSKLLYTYPDEWYHIFQGVISWFNPDDIAYFCKYCNTDRPLIIEKRQHELEIKFNYLFGWVLSPTTMDIISKFNILDIPRLHDLNKITGSWSIANNKELLNLIL